MATWHDHSHLATGSLLSASFEARQGGRMTSLLHGGVELSREPQPSRVDAVTPFPFGLMAVGLHQESRWHDELMQGSWTVLGVENAGVVDVKLEGTSPRWAGIGATKRFRITDDPWIDWTLDLITTPAAGSRFRTPGFVVSSVMHGHGRVHASGTAGVMSLPRWPQAESWLEGVSEGWCAWVDGGGGLAWTFPVDCIRALRIVHGEHDRVEWVLRRLPGSPTLTGRMMPFEGLARVDAVGDAGVASFQRNGGVITVALFALRSDATTFGLTWHPDAGPTEALPPVSRQTVAGAVTTATFNVAIVGSGRWSVTIHQPGADTSFEVREGVPSIGSLVSRRPALPPQVEAPREESGSRPRWPKSLRYAESPVPHRHTWLRRTNGERISVLALVPSGQSASVIALADAFDFDLTLPFIPDEMKARRDDPSTANQEFENSLGDRTDAGAKLTRGELESSWMQAAQERRHDVVLLLISSQVSDDSNLSNTLDGWNVLPEPLQQLILDKIELEGTGLVAIRRTQPKSVFLQPNQRLEQALVFLQKTAHDTTTQWQPVGDDPTTAGLPWSCIPGFTGPGINQFNTERGAPLAVATVSATMPILGRGAYGRGRVLDLVWGSNVLPLGIDRLPPAGTNSASLRYDLALLGRLILDASGKVPPLTVARVTLLDPTQTTGNLTEVEFAVNGSPHGWTLQWVARNRRGDEIAHGHTGDAAAPSAPITLPTPAAAWFVDVVVLPDVGEPAWGAGALVRDIPLPSGTPTMLDRHQQLAITPVFAGASLFRVRVLDGRGRVLEDTEISAGFPFTLDAERVDTPAAEVYLHALDATLGVIGEGLWAFQIRREAGVWPWTVHIWAGSTGVPAELLARRFDANRAFGADGLGPMNTVSFEPIGALDRLGQPYVVRTAGDMVPKGGTNAAGEVAGSARSFLSDAQEQRREASEDASLAATLAGRNVLYYRGGGKDEPQGPPTNTSFYKDDLDAFRCWLRGVYGDASAFHDEWGPGAGPLESAYPLPLAAARTYFDQTQSYAPWVDHRLYALEKYAILMTVTRDALVANDPLARIGSSGVSAGSLHSGIDPWLRAASVDVEGHYGGHIGDSYVPILHASNAHSVLWTGYGDPAPLARYRVFAALGVGASGIGLFKEDTLLNPDLTLGAAARDMLAALLPVRRGLGELFAASEPYPHGVFVLHSSESSAVLAIAGYDQLGEWIGSESKPSQKPLGTAAREHIYGLLRAVGVSERAISPAAVERGELFDHGARVLILPMAAALSKACCDGIEEWVAAGGVVIADVLPGVYDEHGRLRGSGIDSEGRVLCSTNPLDAVFGLTPAARPRIADTTIEAHAGETFPVSCSDETVHPWGAYAFGETADGNPAWLHNNHGRGSAWYLGCSFFADFWPTGNAGRVVGVAARRPGDRADRLAAERAFLWILHEEDVQPAAEVVDANGARVGLVDIFPRRCQGYDLIVVARGFASAYEPVLGSFPAQIRFPSTRYTWDPVDGNPLGQGDRVDVIVDNHMVRVFARALVDARPVALRMSKPVVLGKELRVTARLRTRRLLVTPHLLRLDVLDRDGCPIAALGRQQRTTTTGEATFVLHTAVNDPPGPWTIVVTDVVTGLTTTTTSKLEVPAADPPLGVPFQVDRIDD